MSGAGAAGGTAANSFVEGEVYGVMFHCFDCKKKTPLFVDEVVGTARHGPRAHGICGVCGRRGTRLIGSKNKK